MRKSKQEIERYYFEMFQRDYPMPDGTIAYGDKPDVIMRGERKIGIELTNFYLEEGSSSESEQVQRGIRQRVVTKAQSIHREKGGAVFDLVLGFDKSAPIRDENELAAKIALLAPNFGQSQNREVDRGSFSDIPELSFMYVIRGNLEDVSWRVSQVYTTPIMSLERLNEIIETKEKKANEYEPCDAYWLLAVVDFIDRAQDQEVRIDRSETVSSNIFERVIVYKTTFGQFMEWNCQAQGIGSKE